MSRRVVLLVNRTKPEVLDALPEVRQLVARAGGRVVHELAADHEPLPAPLGADLIVVLGGDGTLLSQCRRCVDLNLPLMGVNFGKLGFMAEFDMASLRLHHASVFGSSPLVLADRLMMSARVVRAAGSNADEADAEVPHALALNDVVLTAGPPFRMIEIGVRIDGHVGPVVAGDGVVVSTPIGSTAYNASAGGPIMAPDVEAMVITPIAAHSLSFRPVVVCGRSTIDLTLGRVNDSEGGWCGSGGTTLVVDGQIGTRLHAGDVVRIAMHPRPVHFVRNPDSQYWDTLIQKMHWAARPTLRG
jgi:NAD+ kinase